MKEDKINDAKLTENEIYKLKPTTCCFTGHRSQKLPWKFNENDKRFFDMKARTKIEIEKAIANGYTTFISGMALGFDMLCAELVLELKKDNPNIKLIGALPCKNQQKLWIHEQQKRYGNLLKQLDGIRCKYDAYNGSECMLERNRYMIDNSSLCIALFNGLHGGTESTINYAKNQGLKLVIIKPLSEDGSVKKDVVEFFDLLNKINNKK
ncbi:MAG: SLOG family protein [Clostridia bacterium]